MNESRGWISCLLRALAAGTLAATASLALAQEVPPPPAFPAPPPEFPAAPTTDPVQAPPPPPEFLPPASVPGQAQPPQFGDPAFQTGTSPDQSPRQTLKRLFAGTLATVAQSTGTTLLVGLTQLITGGLTDWFSRKLKVQPGTVPGMVPDAQAFPAAPAFPPPPQGAPPPPEFASAPPPQFFDAQTGAETTPDPAFAAVLDAPADSTAVFAGLAYEVHAVGPNGAMAPVNPATHEFRTGDRFVVFYRPTLPGQMDVINVNPAGQRTQIDRVDLAAGQLAQLGPYEFAALTGDEQLKLVLSPCQTPALMATTRDIINVSAAPDSTPEFSLAGCSPVTRSIREVQTRDIRKVAVEGTTGFALDPVSAAEFSSGQVTPREVTISFRHR
ncbi:MAG: hypothetical protein WD793_00420 [Steroidobacteraceae bacterium]